MMVEGASNSPFGPDNLVLGGHALRRGPEDVDLGVAHRRGMDPVRRVRGPLGLLLQFLMTELEVTGTVGLRYRLVPGEGAKT